MQEEAPKRRQDTELKQGRYGRGAGDREKASSSTESRKKLLHRNLKNLRCPPSLGFVGSSSSLSWYIHLIVHHPPCWHTVDQGKRKMSQADKMKQGQFTNPETPGYVGFANLPNQVHRKSVKKGFEFTLMVVGESGLGKSTLINSLFLTDLYPERVIPGAAEKIERTVQIEASTVEIEERGVKLRLTVVDTPGYGDAINSQDCFSTIIAYIDDQFERYLHDESGLNRRHIVDNRVHCCFYFISPLGHGLKPLDVQFMKAIHNKVNVVPVIAKADTLTLRERERLKRRILDEIDEHGIKIYHLPDAESDEDEDFKEQTRILKASIPFAVVGSNQQIEAKGKKVRGRLYPWGVVEVENPEHNDFLKLRTMLITHMQDLQEVTQDLHYENFRSDRLKRGGRKAPEPEEMDKDMILQEKEAELRRMQEMIAKMQAQMLNKGEGDGQHV
ncbi:Septin-2 [Ilyodon furcidens]|uniref:Septin-2 n=4 Tax=Goodeidae TaxID=28758 RepID=A0ABV0UU25_9TELE